MRDDLANAIHVISDQDKREPLSDDDAVGVTGFTNRPGLDQPPIQIDPNDKTCWAKVQVVQLEKTQKKVYFIRQSLGGRLYDPWDTVDDRANRRYAEHAGKIDKEFTKVSEECFMFYMRYLQSRNPSQLINADRIFKNQ
jgi:hypothetical protein